MNRAIFLDRDGVINRKAREGEYITRWEEMEILPGVPEAIRTLNQAGFEVVIATNQRSVAKGLISIPELEILHARLCNVLAGAGARIDAVYYCPHEKVPACRCRKPSPGMLLDAARDRDLELGSSWMIGDSVADVEAGQAAGCKTVLVGMPVAVEGLATLGAASLLDATHQILNREQVGEQDANAKYRVGI